MDTKLKVLYEEDVIHDVILTGTPSSDKTTKHYYGEKVYIPISSLPIPDVAYMMGIEIQPYTEETNGDKDHLAFYMPDYDVTVTPHQWPLLNNIDGMITVGGYLEASSDIIDTLVIPATYEGVVVKSIGYMRSHALKNVVISDGIKSLLDHAFSSSTLESINIPRSMSYISESAFLGCRYLKSINIDNISGAISGAPWGAFSSTTVNWLS